MCIWQVDFVLKHYKDLSPYLRTCNSLQLSPDFLIPQDMMMMMMMGDEEMTNDTTTPRSTIVDCEMSSCTSASSDENLSSMAINSQDNIVRKKRSAWNVCARLISNKVSDEDMATSISRRKGIPHRSPLC